MRMSCNGCRVLRKGCSENCSIRPCLQWIKSPDSQANATVFLAKFYGRAGLMNLINAGPDHVRPAIFRSLLYEACGRIVNPIYGSVGLLWSGQWQLCQAAVEAVLRGEPITPISAEDAASHVPQAKAYDIRHVTREDGTACNDHNNNNNKNSSSGSSRVRPNKARAFKRVARPKPASSPVAQAAASPELGPSTSHGSSEVSHPDEATTSGASVAARGGGADVEERGDGEVELDLTLGFGFGFGLGSVNDVCKRGGQGGVCKMELGVGLV